MPGIKFYGSQVGGSRVTPHSYTGSPLELVQHDILTAFSLWRLLPNIVFPAEPCRSGEFCELYPSIANLWCIFLHLILFCMQLPFILSVPFWLLFPGWMVVVGVTIFGVVNQGICFLLNGRKLRFKSDPRYARLKKEHAHEQWIFLNGVAVGKHWMQSNIDRLALTFSRPILGVHNPTSGVIFDILQCLIQRNFNYATMDVRDCYKIIKATLYDPNLTKVIFILHSQGAIEGGMILDWLLVEVPQDLLAKLEIYTFGNAANHFNNPHLHLLSQNAALKNPRAATLTKTKTHIAGSTTEGAKEAEANGVVTHKETEHTSTPLGKTIHHIEHYAHTTDPVSRWGVLHFITSSPTSPLAPRFMGRVFERNSTESGGHQFCLHYLDSMFPLLPCENGGIGGSGFDGAKDESAFMEEEVEWFGLLSRNRMLESLESSELSARGEFGGECGEEGENGGREKNGEGEGDGDEETQVGVVSMSPISVKRMSSFESGRGMTGRRRKYKVKDLSRLWLYRNGRSPRPDAVDAGIARMATI